MDLARILAPCDDAAGDAARPSLPAHLLRGILASLVHDLAREKLFVAPQLELPDELRAAACVSHEWHTLAHDTSAALALAQLRASVVIARRTELLELRRRVTLQRAFLRSVVIDKAPLFGAIGHDHWEAALCLAPQLEELHLVFRDTQTLPRLTEIVRAAGKQCPNIRHLVLPFAPAARRLKPFQSSLDQFQNALFGALEAWSRNGYRGGVRTLKVDMQHHIPDVATTRAYVETLIKYCPNIEVVGGFTRTLTALDEHTCDEQWMLDIPTWTSFCESLTNLRKFDWAFVPFATDFFEIFGKYPKPHLKSLDLTPISNWKWASYMSGLDTSTRERLKTSGYAFSAKNLQAVLRACPNLEELRVAWSFTSPHSQVAGGDDTTLRQFMNPEIINDEFCEAIIECCPRLEQFSVYAATDELSTNRTIRTFTDRGLRALAKLPFLKRVDIGTPDITGEGLYGLVIDHNATSSSGLSRDYHFDVGEQFGARDDTFYTLVLAFLKLVAAHEEEFACEDRGVHVEIRNMSKALVETAMSEAFLTELRALSKTIQEHHPPTVFTLITSKYKDGAFACAEKFMFGMGPESSLETLVDDAEDIDDIVCNRIVEDLDESEPDWDLMYGFR